MERLQIPYPVIVEGKYDRLRLLSVIDAQILTTDGFGIFRKNEKLALFRALAKKTPIIVLTDPDGAGTLIRAHIGSAIPKDRLIPLYVPRIKGVEARKKAPSAQGFLGVEGQERDALYALFLPFCRDGEENTAAHTPLTKTDLFTYGLTGGKDSRQRRTALACNLDLPSDMTPNALLAALNVILSPAQFHALAARLFEE